MTPTPDDRATPQTLEHEDLSQQELTVDGMQGATGSADANGLDPTVDLAEKVQELQENLRPLTHKPD